MKFKILFWLVLFFVKSQAQCDAPNFTASSINGTCLSNSSITVQIPGASTCTNWVAILDPPTGSDQSQNVTANGGPVIFGSLSPGSYNVRLFNGTITIQLPSNPILITSSYVPMAISATGQPTTCRIGTSSYSPNGLITINKTSGGNGPFTYQIIDNAPVNPAVLQTFGPTSAISHTFSGFGDGQTVRYRVIDQPGVPGCTTSSIQSFILPSNVDDGNIIQDIEVVRNCLVNCNTLYIKSLIEIRPFNSPNALARRAAITTAGNATISINGGSLQNLPVRVIDNGFVGFDSPNLTFGDTFTLRYFDGCQTVTRTRTIGPASIFTGIQAVRIITVNDASCAPSSRFSFQRKLQDSNGLNYSLFCQNANTLTVQKEQPSGSGNWVNVALNPNTPNPFSTTHPFLSDNFTVTYSTPGTGNYRAAYGDACVTKNVTFVSPTFSNLNNITLSEIQGVLQNTSAISINNISSNLSYPLSFSITSPTHGLSVNINPTSPLNLAGSYNISFPYNFVHPTTTSDNITYLGDLPPGTYNVKVTDACGIIVNLPITLAGRVVNYNPSFSSVISCANSSSLTVGLNTVHTYALNSFSSSIELYTNNGSGGLGTLVQIGAELRSTNINNFTFNNLAGGNYIVRYPLLYAADGSGKQYSMALGSVGFKYVLYPVTIQSYADIIFSTSQIQCDIASSKVTASIDSGTPSYPITYQIFNFASPNTIIETYTANNAADINNLSYTFATLSPGSYFVRISSSCQIIESSIIINGSNSTPSVTATNLSICSNETSTLSISLSPTQWNITWLSGSTVLAAGVNSLTVTPSISTTYTVQFNAIATAFCPASSTQSQTLTIAVTTVAPPTSGGNQSVCSTSPIQTLTAVATTGTNQILVWYSSSIAGSVVSSPTLNAVGSITYYAQANDNTSGCVSATRTPVTLIIRETSTAPAVGTITQPTCTAATGSVVLNGLPSGNWTITQLPGNVVITGTGTSTTISGLVAGTTYTYTVTNAEGCTSASSANVIIQSQPITPSAPTVGTITQPTCTVATGSVVLNGLPNGNWTTIQFPGNAVTTGTGSSTTISGLAAGITYTYTVTNAANCISASSANVIIQSQPITPSAPTVGTITQPTCTVATGSVVLNGLPTGNWTITQFPGNVVTTGTSISTTISGLSSGITYTYTVTNAAGCISGMSSNVTINAQPLNIAQVGATTTTCSPSGLNYTVAISVNGVGPYTATGTGSPGIWSGNNWVSSPIVAGVNYTISIQDSNNCNILNISGPSAVCCLFTVVCPTIPVASVNCYSNIPTQAIVSATQFEALGNGGYIGNNPCGVIVVTASNSNNPGCSGNVIRTYIITEYADPNNNDIRDIGENTVLNSQTCTQNFNISAPVVIMPANILINIVCASSIIVPTPPTVTDNCGRTLASVLTITTATPTCVGTKVYTFTYTDCANVNYVWTYTYSINDNVAPIFTGILPTNVTLECTATIPTPAVVTATDNCSTATVTYLEQTVDGSCVGNKVVTRTWIATDACNNRIQHVQTINLIDSKPPVFDGILPSNIVLTCDTLPMASTLTATDNCGNATVTFSESKVDGSCSSQYDLLRTWTAEDACGNISTHIQQIKVTCFVEIFNAVSPNGDGKNDFFLIEGIDCFPKNSLQIFNRWGVNVFEINGYDNVKNVFAGFSDGRASISRSKLLPTGTYFYILNYEFSVKGSTPQNKEKSGYLYIQSK